MKPFETLARAFESDPVFEWVLADRAKRLQRLEHIFRSAVVYCNRVGGVADIEGSAGVGIWTSKATMEIGVLDGLRNGSAMFPVQLGPVPLIRLIRHETEGDHLVRSSVSDDFAYLMAVGVDPERRGEGLGRRTIDVVETQAKEAGHRLLALRTENASNVALYRHLGFDLVTNGTARSSELEVWVMTKPLT